MNAAAKDAELYLRRCKELEAVNADLLAALEEVVKGGPVNLVPLRKLIAKAKGES